MRNRLLNFNKIITVTLITAFLLTQCKKAGNRQLEEGFANPTIENRPLAFWPWLNGYVDTAKLVYELKEMKDKGMQGAFIWDVGALSDPGKIIPAGPAFLGDKSLGYISLALKTGGRLGLNLGMIASSSWNAGGDWIEEKDASKEMLSVNQIVTGPSKKKIVIGKPKGQTGEPKVYSLISSIAVPHSGSQEIDCTGNKTISLDKFTSENKYIEWEVPEGQWDVISFFMCNTGQNLECPSPNSNGPMIDHLSQRATKSHFDTILTRLSKVSTPDYRLKYLEVDSYEVWPAKDWTPGFIEEFVSRFGYDPKPYFPLIQGYSSKDTILGKRFLGDYSRLVSDLIIENHFGQSVEITNKAGIQMFAEAGHGGYPRVDPLKALGNTNIPMGEFWNRQQFWVTKEAASAAHIYGKKLVASESLTGWQNWQHGPTDYKQLFDVAFCEGLNQVVFHTFAHNPEIAGKPGFAYHAGEHLNVNTTWWEMARPFMDYLSRCSYMLRQGNFVGDACLYYGDQAPNLVPSKRIDPNLKPLYDDNHCLHCGLPKPVNPGELMGYDYDYINSDIITKELTAENGKLVLPSGQSYRVMLLPDKVDISLEVLKSLEKLVSGGAVIIGRRPERTTSLKNYPECDAEVKSIADKLWGKCDGEKIFSNRYGEGTIYWGKSVKQVLEELNVGPDFEVKETDNRDQHIDYIHRKTVAEDIYFVSNSSQSEQEIKCTFRVDKSMVPELWDAESGLIQRDVKFSKVKNGISIEMIMNPVSSRFVVFRNSTSGKNDAGLKYDLQYGFHKNQNSETNYEPIDISADWDVSFNPDMGGPKSFRFEKLISWSDIDEKGIKYYSGSATYTRNFIVKEKVLSKGTEAYVNFGDIQEMARVFINGKDCGIVWTPPYKALITPYLKAGSNTITVQVTNTWNNRIVGDLTYPDDKAYTRTNIKNKFVKKNSLLNSGLIGRAEIFFTNR
jgi:hypothetical protein